MGIVLIREIWNLRKLREIETFRIYIKKERGNIKKRVIIKRLIWKRVINVLIIIKIERIVI